MNDAINDMVFLALFIWGVGLGIGYLIGLSQEQTFDTTKYEKRCVNYNADRSCKDFTIKRIK